MALAILGVVLAILGVVVTPLNDMGKCLFGALMRHINYLTNYHANIRNLRSQVNLLEQKRTEVRRHITAAESRLDVLSEEVRDWLQNTARTLEEDMRTFEENVKSSETCLKGMCPDIIYRLKLSKKAVQMLEAVNSLLQQQGKFTVASIAHRRPAAHVELVRTNSIVENLPSRDKVMKDVMEALGNDSIKSIAVHGMRGIGKTTLVDKINNELHGSQLFKKVIKLVVSKKPDLYIIQDIIAARLDLDLKQEPSIEVRANRLFERLMAEESTLIILDNLWEKLNVHAIGIPGSNEHIGCKIMLTTHDFNICNQMKIQTTIKMEPLSEDESRALFETKVGDVVGLSNLKPIAHEIVRRCKGLPLAIAALGLTLAKVKDQYVWEDALRILKNPSQSGLHGIMPEVVEAIRFSYDHLHSREIKLCFLFCCLFPEDYNIDLLELRDYGVGEQFLNVNESLEEASNELLSFVKRLRDCGLLLEGDEETFVLRKSRVKMHDVVRDVAIAIASDDENSFLVNIGRPLRNLQETEKLKGLKRMSFMRNENLVLPDPALECPQLSSLLIKENASMSNEESCFEGMKSLVVLDVSKRHGTYEIERIFAKLPSFQCLSNLRTLYLMHCDLSTNVSLLAGLRKLEILRLCHSNIGRLPEEIGNLSNLMCLDLNMAKLSIVAPNGISRLSNLEELYMLNGYDDWDQVGRGDEPNASLVEVTSLNHLSVLRICIGVKTPHDMQFHWWNKLKEFHVMIHPDKVRPFSLLYDRPSLSYDSSSTSSILAIFGVNPLEHWVSKLLSIPKVRELKLLECFGVTNVADLVAMGGGLKQLETPVPTGRLQHLNEVILKRCDSLEHLSSYSSAVAFESVENIYIWECNGMKNLIGSNSERGGGGATYSYTYSSISTISPPPPTFPNLQFLDIHSCGNLKSLFSFNMARNLQQLRELAVVDCQKLEDIISEEEEVKEVEHQHFLPRLESLKLLDLRTLRSIIQGNLPISCLLKTIRVVKCPNLKKLPLQSQIASSLKTFEGSTEWFEGLEWEDESLRSLLQEKFKVCLQ